MLTGTLGNVLPFHLRRMVQNLTQFSKMGLLKMLLLTMIIISHSLDTPTTINCIIAI